MNEPWSKQHKLDFKGKQYSLSNSFAEPLTLKELFDLTRTRQKDAADATADTIDNANDNNDSADLIRQYQQDHTLEYTPNGGSLDLRRAIAKCYYKDEIQPEHILVFPGAQVALQTAAQAVLQQDQNNNANQQPPYHAIVFTPGYQSVVESPAWIVGPAHVTQIARWPEHGWQIDLEAVRAAIIPGRTRYLILNEPHNPSGTVMTRQLQHELIDLCRQHEILVLCDEVYRLLEHDDEENDTTTSTSTTITPMATAYPEGGISCVTLSKPWGGCGITIGWLATQNPKLRDAI